MYSFPYVRMSTRASFSTPKESGGSVRGMREGKNHHLHLSRALETGAITSSLKGEQKTLKRVIIGLGQLKKGIA